MQMAPIMIGIVFFAATLLATYLLKWYIAGAIIAGFTAINGFGAALKAYRDPDWYVARRRASGDPAYNQFLPPDEETVQRHIQHLLLVKILTCGLFTALTVFFLTKFSAS